jgi:glutamine synthetase
MPTRQRVVERCSSDDIDLVRIFYVDSAGVTRGRVVPARDVAGVLEEGINFAKVQQSFTVLDYPVPGTEISGPVGEVRLVPDSGTFVELPYAERTAAMVGSFHTLDGEPWAVGPRARLQELLGELEHTPVAAFESEYYLGRRPEDADDGELVPLDGSGCFAADGMQSAHEVVLDTIDALESQGMELAIYYPEYGPGQQELVVTHDEGVAAADHQTLYKRTVKGVAGDHGLEATFLPKPFPELPGSGCHLHLSLWDDERNAFYDADADARYGLSGLARSFVAGVLEHAPGLVALTAPTVTSYKRLKPSMWASAFVCWGEDNREAMVRVPSASASNPAGSTRIEYKPIDNTANPYLAMLGVLAAGRDGIERGLDPGEPLGADPATLSAADRADRGIERYPETLSAALEALAEDDVLREALGEPLLESYLAVKRAQWEEFDAALTDWELEHLRDPF